MWKGAVLFPKSISLRADGFLSRGSPPKQMYAFILMNARWAQGPTCFRKSFKTNGVEQGSHPKEILQGTVTATFPERFLCAGLRANTSCLQCFIRSQESLTSGCNHDLLLGPVTESL